MKDPLVYLVKMLLKNNGLKINAEELEFQLRSHPTYPSLHAVTGVLDHFSVKNYALEVPKSNETLNLLPNSFMALVKNNQHNGLALINKNGDNLGLSYNETQQTFVSKDDFLNAWTGVIVIIDEESKKVSQEAKGIFTNQNIFIAVTTLISIYFIYKNTLFPTIHFLLSIAGLAICILILHHDLGITSKMLNKFCSENNKKTSCDDVLNSKGANLFGYFKLSDIGIIYFVSLILSWILLKNSSSSYYPLIAISLLALPFTLFSIYYQFKIVKKWCLLCLTVVSVLWLQAIALIFSDFSFNEVPLNLNAITITALCFLVSFAVWQFISPILKKEQELNMLKIEHFKFKRNYSIFKSLIEKSEQIDTHINDNNSITFCTTKEKSPIEIIVITNPLCGFCKSAHLLVEKLLTVKDKSINIKIRFNVSDEPNSIDSRIALRLLEIYNLDGDQLCLNAMSNIYSSMKPTDWLLKWGEPTKLEYRLTLTKDKEWCRRYNINFTPEILVNGRSYPKEYDRFDLLYFIDDIVEEEAGSSNFQESELVMTAPNN